MTRLLAFLALSLPAHAYAHDAPAGWPYDPACCSTRDCAAVPDGRVTAGPDGWRIELQPGDHPSVTARLTALIPFDSPKVRVSGDEHFHPCISPGGYAFFCLYVPPMGF